MEDIRELVSEGLSEENLQKSSQRDKVIIRTGIIGIVTNLLLAAFKVAVGLVSRSIAIVLDAVNNTGDAASSVITIIGTRLAAKEPTKKHPWGYGRIEYLTSMIISIIVLYAGVTSLVESVKKIIRPETPDYTIPALIIVGVGILVKIALGIYVKKTGRKVSSGALINSGADALNDAIISTATLVSAIVFMIFKIKTEAYLGAIISAVIIKSGIEMLLEALSKVLGERVSIETGREVRNVINSFPEVHGSYDLVFNDYGSDKLMASVHVEVADSLTARDIDMLTRRITAEVYVKTGVALTAVGIYSMNTKDPEILEIRAKVHDIVFSHPHILQLHGFFVNTETNSIQFDIIIDFDEKDKAGLYRAIHDEVAASFPEHRIYISLDRDFSLSE